MFSDTGMTRRGLTINSTRGSALAMSLTTAAVASSESPSTTMICRFWCVCAWIEATQAPIDRSSFRAGMTTVTRSSSCTAVDPRSAEVISPLP